MTKGESDFEIRGFTNGYKVNYISVQRIGETVVTAFRTLLFLSILFVASCATMRSAAPKSEPAPPCAPDFCEIHLEVPGWIREPCREPCPDGRVRSCACMGMMLPEGEYCPCILQSEINRCTKPQIDCKNTEEMPGAPCIEYVEPIP